MSQFYNPHRSSNWNYGGKKWKLSRSKLDQFIKCPRCFYIDNKFGTKQPGGFPFNLNSAVDTLLKKEFDIHRADGTPHPLQQQYKLDAVPAMHKSIDMWRYVFEGVQCLHEPTGMIICGAIDDLWINSKGEYIVVDYKATAKDEAVKELDQDWQDTYKRQMEVYQWLLRQNDLKVSDTGYFVYCTGKTDVEAFDGKIEFDINVIPYTGKDDWVEGKIIEAHQCLESSEMPEAGSECDYCAYVKARNKYIK